jgi:hypothetical protein
VGSNQYQKRPGRDLATQLDPPAAQHLADWATDSPAHQAPAALAGRALIDTRSHGEQEIYARLLQTLQQVDRQLAQLRQAQLAQAQSLSDPDWAASTSSEVFVQLIEDLDRVAPPGHWFGPHPGNMNAWGYWPEHLAPPKLLWSAAPE